MLSFKKYGAKRETKTEREGWSIPQVPFGRQTERQMMNAWVSLRCRGADRMISKRGKEVKDIAEIRDHSDDRGEGGQGGKDKSVSITTREDDSLEIINTNE